MTAFTIKVKTDERNLMKTPHLKTTNGRARSSGVLDAMASLLLAALPLAAAVPTITGAG